MKTITVIYQSRPLSIYKKVADQLGLATLDTIDDTTYKEIMEIEDLNNCLLLDIIEDKGKRN